MNDLHTALLSAAHPARQEPVFHAVIDADVRRGRQALNRRRLRQGGGRTVLAAAVAVGLFTVTQPFGPSHTPSTSARPSSALTTLPATQLVAWTGTQPEGYTVEKVPAGWEIQGVNAYTLTIARVGDADQDINSFTGKLIVMLMSKDAQAPTTGTRVAVGTHEGFVQHSDPSTTQLFVRDEAGHWIAIQVPASLRWTDAQVGAFAASVHVTADAQAGVG